MSFGTPERAPTGGGGTPTARGATSTGRGGTSTSRGGSTTGAAWARLRRLAAIQAGWLRPPLPPGPGVCAVCRGPARADYLRCFHCGLHAQSAPGLLADAIVPVSYAIKGDKHAHALWLYKSARTGAVPAQAALASLLLVFLRDHCSCAWRMAGGGAPTHLAVVPRTRGRPGPHPLHALTAPLLTRPWAELALPVRSYPPDPDDRDLGLDRFILPSRLPGARVLLLDDTWTTGSRAQSAAAALKLAGATRVVVVVLGRHLNMGDDGMERIGQLLRDHRYRVGAGRMWPCPARGSRVRTCFAPLTSHQCTVDQPGTFGPNMLVAAHEILDRNVCGGSEKEG